MTKEELRDYVDEQRGLGNIPYHIYSTLIDGIDTLEQELCGRDIYVLTTDAISRKTAILEIQRYGVGCFDADEFDPEQAERFVINRLNGLPSIQSKSKIEVLDKIIAEIQNLRNYTCDYSDEVIDDVEDIIDKYKAESEG